MSVVSCWTAHLSWANNLIVNPDTKKRTGTAAPTLHSLRHDSTPPRTSFSSVALFHLRFSLPLLTRPLRASPSLSLVSPSSRFPPARCSSHSHFASSPHTAPSSSVSHGQAGPAAVLLGNASFRSVNHRGNIYPWRPCGKSEMRFCWRRLRVFYIEPSLAAIRAK